MIILKKLFSFFIIFMCSFQMAFGEVVSRLPASDEYIPGMYKAMHEVDALGKRMRKLRRRIRGDHTCNVRPISKILLTDEEIENGARENEEYGNGSESLTDQDVEETNANLAGAFGQSNDEESSESYYDYLLKILSVDGYQNQYKSQQSQVKSQKSTPKITKCNKNDDIIYDLIFITSRMDLGEITDKDDLRDAINTRNLEKRIERVIKDARKIREEVLEFVYDRDELNDRYKAALLIRYTDDIALSMKELSSLVLPLRIFEKELNENFLIDIPMSLVPEKSGKFYVAEDGTEYEMPSEALLTLMVLENGMMNGQPLEIKADGDHWKLKFKFERVIQTYLNYPTSINYLSALRMLTVKNMINQLKEYDFISGGSESKKVQIPLSCVENKRNGEWEEFQDGQLLILEKLKRYEDEIVDHEQRSALLEEGDEEEAKYLENFEKERAFNRRSYLVKLLVEKGLIINDYIEDMGHGYNFGFSGDSPLALNDGGVLKMYTENVEMSPLNRMLWPALENNLMGYANRAVDDFESGERRSFAIRYTFDDFTSWDKFKELKAGHINHIYTEYVSGKRKEQDRGQLFIGDKSAVTKTYRDIELFQDIITRVEGDKEYLDEDEEIVPVYDLGASKYLARKMEEAKAYDVWEVVSDKIKEKLKNTRIILNMPSLYSSPESRNWGIKKLTEVLETLHEVDPVTKKPLYDLNSSRSPFKRSLIDICGKRNSIFCESKDPYRAVLTFLKSLKIGGVYTPRRALPDEEQLEDNFIFLYSLWAFLRDRHKVIPEAISNEYDFLQTQVSAYNRIAMARLSYLVALEDLETIKKEISGKRPDSYKRSAKLRSWVRKKRHNLENIKDQIDRLKDAAEILYLHRPVRPEFLSTVLDKDDQLNLWRKIKEDSKSSGKNLFDANIGGESTMKHIQDIAPKSILTMDRFEEAIDEDLDGLIKDDLLSLGEKYFNDQEARRLQKFQDLMQSDDHEEREDIFAEIAQTYGIGSDELLRDEIIHHDNRVKKLLYIELLERAAVKRKHDIYHGLEKFCGADDSDHETLKSVFYQSLRVQDELNEMAGIDGVPAGLMDRVESMTSTEWASMGLAIGGFVLGAVAIGAAAACTATIVCPILVAGGGAAGFGMQGTAAYNEWGMYFRSQEQVSDVRLMTDLGFSTHDAYENVDSSKAWAIIETVSIVPLVGILSRSLYLGSKGIKHQLKFMKQFHKELGVKRAFGEAGKSAAAITAESEIELAKIVLKFTSYGGNIKKNIQGIDFDKVNAIMSNSVLSEKQVFHYKKKLQAIQKDLRLGKISKEQLKNKLNALIDDISKNSSRRNVGVARYQTDTVVNYTRREIDERTAKTLVEYFGKPSTMVSFLDKYIGRFKNGKIEKVIEKYQRADRGELTWGTNWIRKAWHENTYNMGRFKEDFLKMYDDLNRLPAKDFESYLYKNIDLFTNIFHKAPMRLRTDLPYLLIQGGPHLGKRLGFLSVMGESIIIRKIATARARLIGESVKAQVRGKLGLSKAVTVDALANITKGFFATVENQVNSLSGKAQKVLKKEIEEIKQDLVSNLAKVLDSKASSKNPFSSVNMKKLLKDNGIDITMSDGAVDTKKLYQIIFSPKNANEEAFAHQLLDIAKPEKIFGNIDLIDDVAYKVMEDTINDKTVKGVQKYLAMLKVLNVKKLEKVEVY